MPSTSTPSPPPARQQSGFTQQQAWQPWADAGIPDPFFYSVFADDFHGVISEYVQTKTGNGTIAQAAGDGGLLLFTTNSSTPAGTDICSIQLPVASFSLPALGKKLFGACRIQLSDVINAGFIFGLQTTGVTPFTNPVDGLFFLKATGSATNLLIRHIAASVVTDTVVPTAEYGLVNATEFDLAFYINRYGDITASVGNQLMFGYINQSGTGANPPDRSPDVRTSGVSLSAANLNLTLAVQSGTASSKTMTANFIGVAKER